MAPRRSRAKSGIRKRKKTSKYSGKGLDNELREAFGGLGARFQEKGDSALFYLDKSAAPAPTRREVVRKAYLEKKNKNLDNSKEKSSVKVSAAERKKLERIKANVKEPQDKKLSGPENALADIWESSNQESKKLIGHKRKRAEKSNHEAVKVCHPGGSYNPSHNDHKSGLEKLVLDEQKRLEKSRTPIYQYLNAPVDDIQDEDAEKDETESESESDSEEEAEEKDDNNGTKKKVKKLTRTDRNRKARLKEEALEIAARKRSNIFGAEIEQVSKIKKHIEAEEAEKANERQTKKELRKKALEGAEPVIKINGKIMETPPPIEVVLPSQISENLRKMIPHGNVIADRFRSMQARNLIETGNIKRQKRKPRGRKKVIEVGKKFVS